MKTEKALALVCARYLKEYCAQGMCKKCVFHDHINDDCMIHTDLPCFWHISDTKESDNND